MSSEDFLIEVEPIIIYMVLIIVTKIPSPHGISTEDVIADAQGV